MSGLSPKPPQSKPLSGWDDLDSILQNIFSYPRADGEPPFVVIESSAYRMPEEEIITVAEQQGYKVTKMQGGMLKFE